MLNLVIAVLAIFWAWEALLVIVPWTVQPWLQPLVVLLGATAFCWPDWRMAMAVSGAVGLLHVLVRGVVSSPPTAEAVRLRPGVGSRIPDLP